MYNKKTVLKKLSTVFSCITILICLVSMSKFNNSCDKIKGNVLRLHILANSDSEADQNLKLKVRDRILADTGEILSKAGSYDESVEITEKNLPLIIKSAEDEIRKQGYNYTVSADIGYTDFNTRHYDGYTLPAGEYLALNIKIGEGSGRNWWCVMFPSICLSSSAKLDDKLDDDEIDVITNYDGYKVKFKLVEWYESFTSIF